MTISDYDLNLYGCSNEDVLLDVCYKRLTCRQRQELLIKQSVFINNYPEDLTRF